MNTQHAKAPEAPRRHTQAGGAVLTADQARVAYLKKRTLDLATLAQHFADADESVDYAGKSAAK